MSIHHRRLEVPLDNSWFEGVDHQQVIENVDRLSDVDQFKGAVAAMLDIHRKQYGVSTLKMEDDGVPLYKGLRVSVDSEEGELVMKLDGVPDSSLDQVFKPSTGEFVRDIPAQVKKLMLPSLIRDMAIGEEFRGKASEREQWLREKVARTGLLESGSGVDYRGERYPVSRVSVQGGHHISKSEYVAVADWATMLTMADPGTQFVTGCGDGVMRAPFAGANVAFTRMYPGENRRPVNIGLTEIGILWREAPNPRVGVHFTAPDIESRMEVFLRSTTEGVAFPGGVGTFEEVMTNLGVISHEENQGLVYPFFLIERRPKDGISWMDRAQSFLQTCFEGRLDPFFAVRSVRGDFSELAREMVESRKARGVYEKGNAMWNSDLYIPDSIGEPFHPTPARMEALELRVGANATEDLKVMADLRKMFSAIVHWTVKDQDGFKAWNGDRPKLNGDPEVVKAFHGMVEMFMAQHRIPAVVDEENRLNPKNFPYQIPA